MPRLATRLAVFAPDLLGHGASAKPRGEYTLGAYADILRDLLNDCAFGKRSVGCDAEAGDVACCAVALASARLRLG